MTTAALVVMSLMWWAHWLLFRRMRSSQQSTTVVTTVEHAAGRVLPVGLEDDPDLWHPNWNAWTALDEHQITRLLTQSAPAKGAAAVPTDDAARVHGPDGMS